jgi:hypothetical protein
MRQAPAIHWSRRTIRSTKFWFRIAAKFNSAQAPGPWRVRPKSEPKINRLERVDARPPEHDICGSGQG